MYAPEELMELAIEKARQGIEAGQSPFGCAIQLDGQLIACRHNTVLADPDVTAHAEINALRSACHQSGQPLLERAIVATTCEPCPMCMAALHWARVAEVYFGASIADAARAGFNELKLPAQDLLKLGGSPVRIVGGVLAEPCRRLFQEWLDQPEHQAY
jgi:guanine deaminase